MSEMIQEPIQEEGIRNDMDAEAKLAEMRAIEAERDKFVAFYNSQIDRVKEDSAQRIAAIEFELRGYFMERSIEGQTRVSKGKTQEVYPLPGGKLAMKKQSPQITHDDEVLLPWVKKNAPQFIKTVESVMWNDLKNNLTISGDGMITEAFEVVPGITVEEREDKFAVEMKKVKEEAANE